MVFDKGKFDDWCVYIVELNGQKMAPKDVTYFTDLYNIGQCYPNGKVYQDFLKIYKVTTERISPHALAVIDSIACSYNPAHQVLAEQWFSVVYAGMIAEENKANAILKKRVKRLGIYQLLILGMPADEAATFSYGKKWRELDTIMKLYGF